MMGREFLDLIMERLAIVTGGSLWCIIDESIKSREFKTLDI